MRLMISGWGICLQGEASRPAIVTLALLYESMGNVQYLAYAITLNTLSFHHVQVQ